MALLLCAGSTASGDVEGRPPMSQKPVTRCRLGSICRPHLRNLCRCFRNREMFKYYHGLVGLASRRDSLDAGLPEGLFVSSSSHLTSQGTRRATGGFFVRCSQTWAACSRRQFRAANFLPRTSLRAKRSVITCHDHLALKDTTHYEAIYCLSASLLDDRRA